VELGGEGKLSPAEPLQFAEQRTYSPYDLALQ